MQIHNLREKALELPTLSQRTQRTKWQIPMSYIIVWHQSDDKRGPELPLLTNGHPFVGYSNRINLFQILEEITRRMEEYIERGKANLW